MWPSSQSSGFAAQMAAGWSYDTQTCHGRRNSQIPIQPRREPGSSFMADRPGPGRAGCLEYTMETKTCSKCGETKPVDTFGMFRRNKDGLRSCCLDCARDVSRRYNASEQGRATHRIYRKTHKASEAQRRYKTGPTGRSTQAGWRRQNREKIRAKDAVKCAILAGFLHRGPCEVCGRTDGLIDGHHDDYSKPLEVRWLCRQHHADHHRTQREAAEE